MTNEARPANSGMAIVLAIAGASFLLHLLTASRYGYFGDELYFLACGEHLDWGYVDQPPFIGLVSWLLRHTLGTSLLAMRSISAIAGAALIVLSGLAARELGGRRFAMGLASASAAIAYTYVGMSYLFTMNAFEPLFWTGCAYVVIRIIKTGNQRLWLWFGAIAGLGMQNKYSMAVFAFGLMIGVLFGPERKAFAKPWLYLGGLLAFLIFLPNIIWNIRYDWPFFELMRNIRDSGRDVVLGPVEYIIRQIVNMNPANLPVWLAGLGWLFFSRPGRSYRPLACAFIVTLATFIVTKGKDYYLAPAFAILFAAGGAAIEGFTEAGRRRLLRPALIAVQTLSLTMLPLTLPILSAEKLVRYQKWTGIAPPASEKAHALALLPHHFAWQFGWEEMVASVAKIYHSLSPEEQKRTVIIGNNFGESGAIDLLGRKYGLPKALGTHQSYWLWGPGEKAADILIVIGDQPDDLKRWCRSVLVGAQLSNPYAAVWENRPVLVCRDPYMPLRDAWPQIKNWD